MAVILKCKMCGGNLNIEDGVTTCECEYCGTMQTVPALDNEKKANLFNRANRLRYNNEFDEATNIFGNIVAEFPEEAEGYWGLCLCKYGIEYVDDPATGKKIPTCHRTCFDSIFDDDNFKLTCEYAGSIARRVYRDEAKEIDRLQRAILDIAQNEKPYDIFICYKETSEDGQRTKDSVLAQDMYETLTEKGYKVFFARITLEDKLGREYEPYIFSALNTAKIMLVVGTDYEYFNAVWVKNEWSRFLDMMKKDRSKVLIPCYADIDAYDMPREFKNLQGQDMGKVGCMQDLIRGIGKIISSEKGQPVQPTVINQAAGTNVGNLLKRGFMALEEAQWDEARGFFNRVLDENAEEPQAYVGLLLADCKVGEPQDLENCEQPFDDNANYRKAIRFGGEQLTGQLNGYNQKIRERIEEKKRKAEEEKRKGEEKIKHARLLLGMEESPERIQQEEERHKTELAKLQTEYDAAVLKVQSDEVSCEQEYERWMGAEIARFEEEKRSYEVTMAELEREFSTLGVFSGKRKKEIQEEIARQKQFLRSAEMGHEDIVNQLKKDARVRIWDIRNSTAVITAKINSENAKYNSNMAAIKGGGFGRYPQGENGEIALIEWEILDVKDNRVLLISKYCIDCKKFNEKQEAVTWEKCTLRKWLNNGFLNTAFTAEQQVRIETTKVTADKHPKSDTPPGNDTEDKVFLLSIPEALKYFRNNEARQAKPTKYAIKNGTYVDEKNGNCSWWLRSLAHSSYYAEDVDFDGGILGRPVNCGNGGVRPALWVNLNP